MNKQHAAAVALAAGGLIPVSALGIVINNTAPAPFAPVGAAQDPYVGRIQDERLGTPPFTTHLGTGSLIAPGRVLTAAHVINDGMNQQRFEQFELGGVKYPGLGVQHPKFDKFNANALGTSSINDIGLILIPNMRPNAPLGVVAGLGDNPGAGAIVDIIGFTGVPAGNNTALRGIATINVAPSGVTPSELVMDRPSSGSNLEGGDSGGPMVMVRPGNVRVIIGVHSGGRTTPGSAAPFAPPVDYDTRVNAHLDFIAGEGAANAGLGPGRWSVLNQYNGGSQRWLLAAGNWTRGVNPGLIGNGNFFPSVQDIAILDPTVNSDVGIVVDVDGAQNDAVIVGGLLNDATIDVRGIGGTFRIARDTGGFNSGRIVVRDGGAMSADWSLDNQGEISVFSNNQGTLGTVVLGTIAPNMGALALNNAGTIDVGGRGQFIVSNNNGPIPTGATAFNRVNGRMTVAGDANGNGGLLLTDAMINAGLIDALPLGLFRAPKSLTNQDTGRIKLHTGCQQAQVANVDNSGIITLEGGTAMTVKQLVRADNPPALRNRPGGTIVLEPGANAAIGGSTMTVEGEISNAGEIQLFSVGVGSKLISKPGPANTNRYATNEQSGFIRFIDVGGGGSLPRMSFQDMDFYNNGSIRGHGAIDFTGDAAFITTAVAETVFPLHSTRDVGVRFDDAIDANSLPVRLEAACTDRGVGPGDAFGTNDFFAFDSLCITGDSSVQLTDWENNHLANVTEAIYVKVLGVGAASTLDLNGVKLYYLQLSTDAACNGLLGMFPNGRPIQIPAPSAGGALALLLAGAARRRRR